MIYEAQAEYSKARDDYARSLRIARDAGMPTRIQELNIAGVDLAEGKLPQALAVFSRLKDPLRLGFYHLLSGHGEEAKTYFEKALAEGRRKRHAEIAIGASLGLGLVLERQGDPAGARAALDEAIAGIEGQREKLGTGSRSRFLSGKIGSFSRIEAYEARARVASGPADGFYWAENTKARVLIETLALAGRGGAALLPADFAEQESRLTLKIASLRNQDEAAFQNKNQSRLQELAPELESASKERSPFILMGE